MFRTQSGFSASPTTFRLLAHEDPDGFGSLGRAVWERWTPTLVANHDKAGSFSSTPLPAPPGSKDR